MADLARPALPEVLAALTERNDLPEWQREAHRAVVLPKGVAIRWEDPFQAHDARAYGWTTTDPADAAELLTTRDVLPAGWCDVERRGWRWTSFVAAARSDCEVTSPTPRSIPDLVAVASLGWTAIQRAEELARAACHALREYGCPTPERVVWRVGERGVEGTEVWSTSAWRATSRGRVLLTRGGVVYDNRGVGMGRDEIAPARALWTSGLALHAITTEAVVVTVPPVGGGT